MNVNFQNVEKWGALYNADNSRTESVKLKLEQFVKESACMVTTLESQTKFATCTGETEALMAAAAHQKQIVVQMVSSNPDDFYEYQEQFSKNYWTNPEGFIDGFNGDSDSQPSYEPVGESTRISPFLKLVIIGTASSQGILSAEDYEALARAETVEEVKTIIDVPADQNMTELLCNNVDGTTGWQGTGKDGVGGDDQVWLGFPGAGIQYSYLE
ncbi:hypothetical protein [Aeromonas veronii]|uniref:hypothetical protein n=1 Tax=Aeromonas veronii TaxID=654 RepID=UPI001F3BCAE2|nr:hypothetical protein [Aeromonas veronii]MCF5857719.1 hypothetical protein [Aeromonas veronii]